MWSVRVFSVFWALVAVAGAAELPDYFPKCTLDDPHLKECIINSANIGFPYFYKGDKSAHVIPMNPLHIPKMYIGVKGSLDINITEADILGLESLNVSDFNWDFDKKRLDLDIHVDRPAFIGMYSVSGNILILPVRGHGPLNITFVNCHFKYNLEYEIVKKHGKEFVHFIRNGITYTVDRAYFILKNLFDGDSTLAPQMEQFLDENWKEVNNEVGPGIGNAFAEVFATVLNGFFGKIPFSDLFS